MTALNGVKAVSFDVDGTLWDFERAMRNALRHVLIELGRIDPEAAARLTVAQMIETRDRVHDMLWGNITDLVAIRHESFRQILVDAGRRDDDLASHLADVYFRHRRAGEALYDDVRPTLKALQGSYTLGIVSNGNTCPERFGLEDVFVFTVFSQDCGGVEKPDPKLFEIALEKAGCSASELLHVGDDLDRDVVGARNAGVRGIWLNRDGREALARLAPDRQIHSLRELTEIL